MGTKSSLPSVTEKNIVTYHTYLNNRMISGPMRFAFFPNVEGKSIYLFGEHHVYDKCSENTGFKYAEPIQHVLANVFSSPLAAALGGKRDFFAEVQFVPKTEIWDPSTIYMDGSGLGAIGYRFRTCFQPRKLLCDKKYTSYTRFHYIDVRTHTSKGHSMFQFDTDYTTSDEILQYFMLLFNLSPERNDVEDAQRLWEFVRLIKSKRQSLTTTSSSSARNPEDSKRPSPSLESNPDFLVRIRKELRSTPLGAKIVEFILVKLRFILSKPNYPPLAVGALIMDAYALARMFKTSLTDSPEVWVYAGDAHIEMYINFFAFAFSVRPYVMKTRSYKDTKCLTFGTPKPLEAPSEEKMDEAIREHEEANIRLPPSWAAAAAAAVVAVPSPSPRRRRRLSPSPPRSAPLM